MQRSEVLVERAMRFALLVVAVLAGCGAYKVAASPHGTSAGADGVREDLSRHSNVGCVEVGVERRADSEMAPVVRYAVENHCEQAVRVDLAWAQVIGRTADGAEVALVPALEGRATTETSAVVPPSERHAATIAYRSGATIGQLCVDVASVADVDHDKPQWRCFGNVVSVTMR